MSTTISKKLTYADYAKLPEGAPYQLIDGQLVHEPSPTSTHQLISGNIEFALHAFVRVRKLGAVFAAPLDVYLSEENTFQPDIFFVSRDRLGIIAERRVEGAPDLVIEILSPSTAENDLQKKKLVYEQSGVREYWIVDPFEKSIEVLSNTDIGFVRSAMARGDGSVGSNLLPGFSISLDDAFGWP